MALVSADVWLITVAFKDTAPRDRVTAPAAKWKPKLSNSTDGILKAVRIDGYTETLAHPVFFKTREPFVPPPPVLPKPVVIPPPVFIDPGLVLGGVMILPTVRKAYRTRPVKATGFDGSGRLVRQPLRRGFAFANSRAGDRRSAWLDDQAGARARRLAKPAGRCR